MTKSEIIAALDMPSVELHPAAGGDFYWLNVMHWTAAGERRVFGAELPLEPTPDDIAVVKAKYAEWLGAL